MDQMLRSFLLALLVAAAFLPAGTDAAFAVRRPVKLSGGRLVRHACARGAVRGYQVEPTAVGVGSSGSLVAAWQAGRGLLGADAIFAGTSSDGLTWSTAPVPRLSRCSGGTADAVSAPWLAAGPDGILYLSAATLVARRGRLTGAILVTRSLDGGHAWQRPMVLARDPGSIDDKPTITADPYR